MSDSKNDNTSYLVYIHTNKMNNKKYIGITSKSPEERWRNGLGYWNNKYFYRAIKKYGWDDGFKHEIASANLTEEEACNLEISLIAKFDTTNPQKGYNSDLGGSCGKHSEEIRKKMSEIKKGVYAGENNYFYNKRFYGTDNPRSKKVAQYDLEMNLIKVWDYIKQASNELHIDNSGITACCKGRQKTAFGYIWKYIDDFQEKDKENEHG